MSMRLGGKTALVTGASGGIGEAIARALAEAGCHLIIVARSEARLGEIAAELARSHGVTVTPIALDLTGADAVTSLIEAIEPEKVDILINNAGLGVLGSFSDAEPDDLERMIALNARFPVSMIHAILPHMLAREEPTRIMNVGSVAGHQGVPNMATYAATKAFLNHLSEGLAWELAGSDLKICSLEPGQTATRFFEFSEKQGSFMARFGLLSPERVAAAAVAQLERGKGRCVVGLVNKLLVFTNRILPRAVTGFVVRRMFRDMA